MTAFRDRWSCAKESTTDWIQLVRGEYLEMPGLHLTRDQVQRLWGLDSATSALVINSLIDTGFLRRTQAGAYVRTDRDHL